MCTSARECLRVPTSSLRVSMECLLAAGPFEGSLQVSVVCVVLRTVPVYVNDVSLCLCVYVASVKLEPPKKKPKRTKPHRGWGSNPI